MIRIFYNRSVKDFVSRGRLALERGSFGRLTLMVECFFYPAQERLLRSANRADRCEALDCPACLAVACEGGLAVLV